MLINIIFYISITALSCYLLILIYYNMQLRDYENRLSIFDWAFESKNDYQEWKKLDDEYRKLLEISQTSEDHKDLFNFYKNKNLEKK